MAKAHHEPVPGWTPPSAKERLAILREHRSVAMVGVSSNPARPSNFVATYLLSYPDDFEVTFVNPRESEILGRPVLPSLAELPEPPGIVDAFRRPDDLPGIAKEAVEVGAKVLWVQLGLWSPEAAQIAIGGGLQVVMDRCLKIEHARFYGGLHLAGFDTGEVRSKRARR
jgi:predicted CoA-binding protein